MEIIDLVTHIAAPIQTCFELSLDIDLEIQAAADYGIRAISGKCSGRIGRGERVGWKTKQFGFTVSHVSEITTFEPPAYFEDRMISGIFRSFEHHHHFTSSGPRQTEMRDVLKFSMPLFLWGVISEKILVRRRLVTLLQKRNNRLKRVAESRPCPEPFE